MARAVRDLPENFAHATVTRLATTDPPGITPGILRQLNL